VPASPATGTPAVAIAENLSFRVPLAIRLRSAQSIEQDVQVAEHGENGRVMRSSGSGILHMTIVGGAIRPVIQGEIAGRIAFPGLGMACRLAIWPSKRSPVLVNATTGGVVQVPNWFAITVGWPASMTATAELLLPKINTDDLSTRIAPVRQAAASLPHELHQVS